MNSAQPEAKPSQNSQRVEAPASGVGPVMDSGVADPFTNPQKKLARGVSAAMAMPGNEAASSAAIALTPKVMVANEGDFCSPRSANTVAAMTIPMSRPTTR